MRISQELNDPADEDGKARIRAEVAADREKVLAAGGLFILGTERHESRRIDNQLRGRSGRQGDPGASKFYLSLEDDLMRIFGSRAHRRHAAAARPEGGRGDHPSLGQQGAGEGAAEGRGAQLRDPQEPAQVRRRHERPAQGGLRAAQGADERRRRGADGHRHAPPRRRCAGRQAHPGQRLCRAVERARPACRGAAHLRPRPAVGRLGRGRGHRRRGDPQPPARPPPTARWRRRPATTAATSCGWSRRACCCRSSTRCGRSICWPSIICARASACAPMPSAIR